MTISNFLNVLICGLLLFPGHFALGADSPRSAGTCYETATEAYAYAGMIRGDLQIRWYVMVVGSESEYSPKVQILVDGEVVPKPKGPGVRYIPKEREYPVGSIFFGERWLDVQSAESTIDILVENSKKPECNTKMRVEIPPFPSLTSADISILSELGETDLLKSSGVSGRHELRKELPSVFGQRGKFSAFEAMRDNLWFTKSEIFREYLVYLKASRSLQGLFPEGPIKDWKWSGLQVDSSRYERQTQIMSEQEFKGVECLVMTNLVGYVARYGLSPTLDRVSQVGKKLCSDEPVSKKLIKVSLSIAGGLMARDYCGWFVPTQQAEAQDPMPGTDDPSTTD